MTSDSTNGPTPERELTEQERQALIAQADEHTVFGLAAMMMEVHVATQLKQKHRVANAFFKSALMLQQNPGFAKRFKAAQEAVAATIKENVQAGNIDAPKPMVKIFTEPTS